MVVILLRNKREEWRQVGRANQRESQRVSMPQEFSHGALAVFATARSQRSVDVCAQSHSAF